MRQAFRESARLRFLPREQCADHLRAVPDVPRKCEQPENSQESIARLIRLPIVPVWRHPIQYLPPPLAPAARLDSHGVRYFSDCVTEAARGLGRWRIDALGVESFRAIAGGCVVDDVATIDGANTRASAASLPV